MPSLRRKPEAAKTIQQERVEAEERARALLRALVSKEEWDGREQGHITVVSVTGWTYEIRLTGTSENISRYRGGCHQRVCGGPYQHNDYLDVEASRRNGIPMLNDAAYAVARNRARDEGPYVQALSLPSHDIWLGQYLAIKYDEEAFLKKACVSGRYY